MDTVKKTRTQLPNSDVFNFTKICWVPVSVAAARLIFRLKPTDHIWRIDQSSLAASHRTYSIGYKIALLTYKVRHGSASRCEWSTAGRRTLRSADTNPPVVTPVRLTTVGSRAFCLECGTNCPKTLSLHHHCGFPASSKGLSVQEVLSWHCYLTT